VAAHYASRIEGLGAVGGGGFLESGHCLRQNNHALRLIFDGDPRRGIPACASCHGPAAQKLGASSLYGQHAAYIERQLAAFAQGARQNDINQQMRNIAVQLTPDEVHTIAAYYDGKKSAGTRER